MFGGVVGTGAFLSGTTSGNTNGAGTMGYPEGINNFDASDSNSYYVDSAIPTVRNIPIYALIKA